MMWRSDSLSVHFLVGDAREHCYGLVELRPEMRPDVAVGDEGDVFAVVGRVL
jgi:hypothetical protein